MSRYLTWLWRKVDEAWPPRRITCQHLGCKRPSQYVLQWQSHSMPGSAFWYFCQEHARVEPIGPGNEHLAVTP